VPALRRPWGKINLIGLILVLAVVSGIYWLIFFSKAFLDNVDVKEQITGAYNSGTLLDDVGIRRYLQQHTETVGEHQVTDGFGNVRTAPGLGLQDDDITIIRDDVTQTISIRVDYTRNIVLEPSKKVYALHFHPQVAGPQIIRR
jgi:hypothetical protein